MKGPETLTAFSVPGECLQALFAAIHHISNLVQLCRIYVFLKDSRARKQQLDGLALGHANTSSHTPSSNHRQIGSNSAQATLTRPTSSLPTSLNSPTSRKLSSTSAATVSEHYDPVRWKSHLETSRRYEARLREDHIGHERRLEASRRRSAQLRSNEDVYRARRDAENAARRQRGEEDPVYRERSKSSKTMHHARMRHHPAYVRKRLIRALLMQYPWTRTGLPWKTYSPVVSSEPIERCCSGCNKTRCGGSRLWWHKNHVAPTQSHTGSQIFLCHGCRFSADDPDRTMPEGYEDCKSVRDFSTRKELLHGSRGGEDFAKAERFVRATILWKWCSESWIRDLPWKVHRPVMFDERIYDKCTRCENSRFRSLRLWWRSSTETICNNCHSEGDWNDVMPQGYEDVRTMKELRAREKQLDEEGPGPESRYSISPAGQLLTNNDWSRKLSILTQSDTKPPVSPSVLVLNHINEVYGRTLPTTSKVRQGRPLDMVSSLRNDHVSPILRRF
ncbi:hypothetical protein M436DRAFT_62090 [Aureobasidium namibiae CBS 147.97]|uniref:Uncharacterized protein n=1 Tax=Aureobasidium namibiae CBS 147.97 TaxID=1043004 RepID=A0A074WRE0_9PEZI